MTYIDLEHCKRIAGQIGATATVQGDRVVFRVEQDLGSTLVEYVDGKPFASRHAVQRITGINPSHGVY